MINKAFYTSDNLTTVLTKGTMKHYPIKNRWKVISKREYVVQQGDSMYSLAATIFGEDGEANWPIIADINFARFPDDLQPGEIIYLPIVIINDSVERRVNYAEATSTTTSL